MRDTGSLFLEASSEYLGSHYLPKILASIASLSDADLWWRPHESSNSIANLMLHLSGNVRQWIVSGVGGAPDARVREVEFSTRAVVPKAELIRRLSETVQEAVQVINAVRPETLQERRTIQGRDTTTFDAIYHVVEHFSTHVGQILYISKLRSGKDLGFYQVVDGIARANWPGHPKTGSA